MGLNEIQKIYESKSSAELLDILKNEQSDFKIEEIDLIKQILIDKGIDVKTINESDEIFWFKDEVQSVASEYGLDIEPIQIDELVESKQAFESLLEKDLTTQEVMALAGYDF